MSFVIDASIVMAWLLQDGSNPRVDSAFDVVQRIGAAAPVLLYFEIRNVLLVHERRGRITASQSAEFIRELGRLSIRLAPPEADGLLTLARERKLTVYDASYLELAIREGLPLATLDRALEKAAMAEGVALFGA